jgi:hypothetical protein
MTRRAFNPTAEPRGNVEAMIGYDQKSRDRQADRLEDAPQAFREGDCHGRHKAEVAGRQSHCSFSTSNWYLGSERVSRAQLGIIAGLIASCS